jgi:hypothetical protein
MRTTEEMIKILSRLDPKEPLWCIWVNKAELVEIINDSELTDETDNFIKVDKDSLSDDFFSDVMTSVDNADYVWERFNDDLRETTIEKFKDSIVEEINAQIEADLWEGEADVS